RMDGDERARVICGSTFGEPRGGSALAGRVRKKARGGIVEEDGDSFEAAREVNAGVPQVGDFFVNTEKVPHASTLDVALKDAVRIEEPAHDLVEPGEVAAQFLREFAVAREKCGERAVFDVANRVGVGRAGLGAAVEGDVGD